MLKSLLNTSINNKPVFFLEVVIYERKWVSYKTLGNIGTAAGTTGRTINEKCPIHQGVDTVEVDNDRGWAEWF